MIDGGISIAILALLAGGSWASGKARRESAQELQSAQREFQAALSSYHTHRTNMARAVNEHGIQRKAYSDWAIPRVIACIKATGQERQAYASRGWFNGYDKQKLLRLRKTIRAINILPPKALDNAATIAVGAALLIEIGQIMDKTELIDMSALHHTLADNLKQLPFEGSDELANSLGALGDIVPADILSGIGAILGVGRIGFNLFKTGKNIEQTDILLTQANEAYAEAFRVGQIADRFQDDLARMTENSYAAFRSTVLLEEIVRLPKAVRDQFNMQEMLSSYAESIRRLFESLTASRGYES